MAPTIDALLIADEPDAWEGAGFAVDRGGEVPTTTIGSVRFELVGRERGKRIIGWTLRDAPEGDLDGLATAPSDRPEPAPATHPNGVIGLDHLVVLSPDLARTTAAFEAAGITAKRTRDVDPAQYGFEARQVFFKLGPVVLELVGAATAGPGSDDQPASFFGLAYNVADIDALPARYGDAVGTIKDAVQPGRRIVTLRHRQLDLSVATAFMTPGTPSA